MSAVANQILERLQKEGGSAEVYTEFKTFVERSFHSGKGNESEKFCGSDAKGIAKKYGKFLIVASNTSIKQLSSCDDEEQAQQTCEIAFLGVRHLVLIHGELSCGLIGLCKLLQSLMLKSFERSMFSKTVSIASYLGIQLNTLLGISSESKCAGKENVGASASICRDKEKEWIMPQCDLIMESKHVENDVLIAVSSAVVLHTISKHCGKEILSSAKELLSTFCDFCEPLLVKVKTVSKPHYKRLSELALKSMAGAVSLLEGQIKAKCDSKGYFSTCLHLRYAIWKLYRSSCPSPVSIFQQGVKYILKMCSLSDSPSVVQELGSFLDSVLAHGLRSHESISLKILCGSLEDLFGALRNIYPSGANSVFTKLARQIQSLIGSACEDAQLTLYILQLRCFMLVLAKSIEDVRTLEYCAKGTISSLLKIKSLTELSLPEAHASALTSVFGLYRGGLLEETRILSDNTIGNEFISLHVSLLVQLKNALSSFDIETDNIVGEFLILLALLTCKLPDKGARCAIEHVKQYQKFMAESGALKGCVKWSATEIYNLGIFLYNKHEMENAVLFLGAACDIISTAYDGDLDMYTKFQLEKKMVLVSTCYRHIGMGSEAFQYAIKAFQICVSCNTTAPTSSVLEKLTPSCIACIKSLFRVKNEDIARKCSNVLIENTLKLFPPTDEGIEIAVNFVFDGMCACKCSSQKYCFIKNALELCVFEQVIDLVPTDCLAYAWALIQKSLRLHHSGADFDTALGPLQEAIGSLKSMDLRDKNGKNIILHYLAVSYFWRGMLLKSIDSPYNGSISLAIALWGKVSSIALNCSCTANGHITLFSCCNVIRCSINTINLLISLLEFLGESTVQLLVLNLLVKLIEVSRHHKIDESYIEDIHVRTSNLLLKLGCSSKAENEIKKYLSGADELMKTSGPSSILCMLRTGTYFTNRGDFEEAEKYLHRLGDNSLEDESIDKVTLLYLDAEKSFSSAILEFYRGNGRSAIDFLLNAISCCKKVIEGYSGSSLGSVFSKQIGYDGVVHSNWNILNNLASSFLCIAELYLLQGMLKDSYYYFKQGIKLCREYGASRYLTKFLLGLAGLEIRTGSIKAGLCNAKELLSEASRIHTREDKPFPNLFCDRVEDCKIRELHGDMSAVVGAFTEAEVLYKESRGTSEQICRSDFVSKMSVGLNYPDPKLTPKTKRLLGNKKGNLIKDVLTNPKKMLNASAEPQTAIPLTEITLPILLKYIRLLLLGGRHEEASELLERALNMNIRTCTDRAGLCYIQGLLLLEADGCANLLSIYWNYEKLSTSDVIKICKSTYGMGSEKVKSLVAEVEKASALFLESLELAHKVGNVVLFREAAIKSCLCLGKQDAARCALFHKVSFGAIFNHSTQSFDENFISYKFERAFDRKGSRQKRSLLSVDESGRKIVCSLSIDVDRECVIITRSCDGKEPFVFKRGILREDYDNIMSQFDSILEESKKAMELPVATKMEKRKWWTTREKIDKRMEKFCIQVENLVLGPLKSLLRGTLKNDAYLENLNEAVEWVKHTFKTIDSKNGTTSESIALLLECFDDMESESDLLDFVTKMTRKALSNAKAAQMCEAIKNAVEKFKLFANDTHEERLCRTHVLLLLDKTAQQFPWECLPSCVSTPYARIPSFRYFERCCGAEELSLVNVREGYYIINPGGDLVDSQNEFKDYFDCKGDWEGIVSQVPEEKDFSIGLEQKNLFVYIGHNSGEQYVRGNVIKGMKCKAVALLMGCSSGRLLEQGEFDAEGIIHKYLGAGSPAVVGNLWDVTDKDIDRFSKALFDEIFKNSSSPDYKLSLSEMVVKCRSVCKLKHLVGFAPVVYGMPVYFTQDTSSHTQ
eukprot:Nk52_evm36s2657 gene=Nk52_evmTU36s2657